LEPDYPNKTFLRALASRKELFFRKGLAMAKHTSNDDQHSPEARRINPDGNFLVVGLGASAGGIQALKEFFKNVPGNSGMAYVVILHLSPEHESRLAEILQLTAPVPVTQVTKRVKVVPDHVYVIPPNQNLAMTDGHLAPMDMIGVAERRSPVDLFFRTLAETNESRAVSVILSGTGANGSMGLKRIKEYGGVSFVQDPDEAEYKDMPRNAIATGLVDHVLPVADIPGRIVSFSEHRATIQIAEHPQQIPPTDEQALRMIFTQLRVRTGHDFANYKRATVLRRIERRLRLKELPDIPAYAQFLKEDPAEAQALMKDMLISVTNFFRDEESMAALARGVIRGLFDPKRENEQVRVWVAGCATGEEAYTLAILLTEALASSNYAPQIQLFATDLDAAAIAVAREGFYSEADVADISPERLRRFFNKEPDRYRVKRDLRETILFAVHNVIKDPPFSHLDLISCRNLLIYLNRAAQSRVLEVMHFALNPGGFLFLGASESIEGSLDLFTTLDKDHHIFQSRPVQPRRAFPVPDIAFRPSLPPVTEPGRSAQELRPMERLSYADLHHRLLEMMGPPSLVINEDYDIVHLSARAGQYLQFGGGEPQRNLLKVVRPELRIELRASLYQAIRNRTNVEARGLKVNTEDGMQTINLSVRPVMRHGDPTRGFILVLFEQSEADETVQQEQVVTTPEPLSQHLEDELEHSKAQLRTTVEQYEIQQEELRASNEELQAKNEELRSAAEELETGKEELQSVNEELSTVNQELKIKIEELSHANNDFANLINSTDIGTIFLDRALNVKLFTSRACDAFNLISSDIGRPLSHITTKLNYGNLIEDVEFVLKTLRTIERVVESSDGNWYMIRVLPYRTSDDLINGVVMTFLNITESRFAEEELARSREELESRISERTSDLAQANETLWLEVSERRKSETARMTLLKQLVIAQELERRRLARDLHDQLGQQLTMLRLKLESLKTDPATSDRFGDKVDELLAVTSQMDADVDFLAWELRPILLDDLGLAPALQNYTARWAQQFQITAEFHTTGFEEQRPPKQIETSFYRVAQEALNNVAKHAKASRVDVLLERRDTHAVLIIEDDGIGFDTGNAENETMGCAGMRERVTLIGGEFEIESNPGEGTSVFARVPLSGLRGGEQARHE
jgi:two-component system, chemotaxis family, CheB/CheR fusion protein